MKKILSYLFSFFGGIGIGCIVTYYILTSHIGSPQFQEENNIGNDTYNPSVLSIRVCNKTPTYIDSISIMGNETSSGPYFSDIEPGTCSEYKDSKDLYSHVALTIYTEKDDIRNRYLYILTDTVGVSYLGKGSYTLTVEELFEGIKVIEHQDGVQYNLEKDK